MFARPTSFGTRVCILSKAPGDVDSKAPNVVTPVCESVAKGVTVYDQPFTRVCAAAQRLVRDYEIKSSPEITSSNHHEVSRD